MTMEKLTRIEYNWCSSSDFQYYEIEVNCFAIHEISETQCKVIISTDENGQTKKYAIVTNINTKIFENDYISE